MAQAQNGVMSPTVTKLWCDDANPERGDASPLTGIKENEIKMRFGTVSHTPEHLISIFHGKRNTVEGGLQEQKRNSSGDQILLEVFGKVSCLEDHLPEYP